MRIYGHEATRIHGALQVELEGGDMAILEVDLDVSGETVLGLENHYEERPSRPGGICVRTAPIATKLFAWVKGGGADGWLFRLRMPTR